MIDERFFTSSGSSTVGQLLSGLAVDELQPSFQDDIITGVADLAASKPGDITFLISKKYKADLETAKATACFVTEDCAALVGERDIIPIITPFPRTHFSRVMAAMYTQRSVLETGQADISTSAKVHATAIIAAGAKIGPDVEIHPYAVIGPGVEIGARTVVESHASVECAIIGQDCRIKSKATVGTRGFGVDADEQGIFDLPHLGRAILGDRVSVGCQSAIDRGFLGDTVVGNDVKIDNLVQVAHNVAIGDGSMLAAFVGLSGSCTVGKNVLMGGSVGLADHISVGDGAKIAARAGVMHNVPAGEMWSGIPAMPIRDHMRLISATRKLIQKK